MYVCLSCWVVQRSASSAGREGARVSRVPGPAWRRGPPRGPIKEDKSTFFGKEGEQAQKGGTDLKQVALVGGALLLVGLGLLQIFGTMVTVQARDDKKRQ